MPNTIFVDTNKLPRKQTPQGEVTEILNSELQGAKNVLGTLRWVNWYDRASRTHPIRRRKEPSKNDPATGP